MKRTELNNIFTAKVTEYLSKGYTFNTESMAGHQGEIAKVDLTNGEEVIRVVMEDGPAWEEDLSLGKCITITVGRATEVQFDNTIWNNKLEILDQEVFYQADYYSDYLITKQEAIEKAQKRRARWMAKAQQQATVEITDKKIIKALIPYIHTLKGGKSVKARHITKVEKEFLSDGTYRYKILITRKAITVQVFSEATLKNIRKGC